MKEHFLNYEQSLAIKELGFDEPCLSYYNDGKHICYTSIIKQNTNTFWHGKAITTPLKSQFFKWVREKYEIYSYIKIYIENYEFYYYEYIILDYPFRNKFDSYEEAENECINKIIEIIKLK